MVIASWWARRRGRARRSTVLSFQLPKMQVGLEIFSVDLSVYAIQHDLVLRLRISYASRGRALMAPRGRCLSPAATLL